MQQQNFLPCFYDQELRERLWYLFNYAEKEAQKFAEVNDNWVDIRNVGVGCPVWVPKENDSYAEIQIPTSKGNIGDIFHEVFHSAFHRSALWHSDELHKNLHNNHGVWGEAFCDTFRYFMERELLDEDEKSELFKNIKECLGLDMTPDEIQDRFPNHNAPDHPGCHNLKFKIPISIIIKKVNEKYSEFKSLWRELNERYDKQSETFLEGNFGFVL